MSKLTKKQRSEVVMLLRCAADEWVMTDSDSMWFTKVRRDLDIKVNARVANVARLSYFKVKEAPHRYRALEAALLVEEGSLP